MKLNFESIINSLNAKAHSIYYDNERLKKLITDGKKLLMENKAFSEVIDDVRVSIDLIKQYIKGEYQSISKGNLILIIVGFIYLVHPLDIIPDFLLGGFIDDAAVFAYILKAIQHELDAYREWKVEKAFDDEDIIDEEE